MKPAQRERKKPGSVQNGFSRDMELEEKGREYKKRMRKGAPLLGFGLTMCSVENYGATMVSMK
jgi:hypothetical protein